MLADHLIAELFDVPTKYVWIPYGSLGFSIRVPVNADYLDIRGEPKIEDLDERVAGFCEQHLKDRISADSNYIIIIPDNTRPAFPQLLESIEAKLTSLGASPENISFYIAYGNHQNVGEDVLMELLGDRLFERYKARIIHHDSENDDDFKDISKRTSAGTPIMLPKRLLEASCLIGVSLVEPHFMAGYSGVRKLFLPGCGKYKDIAQNFHGFKFLTNPNTYTGNIVGNPLHVEATEFAEAYPNLALNIACVMNRNKGIVGVYGGSLDDAFLPAVELVEAMTRYELEEPADIVVAACGDPLGKTFYQMIKGQVAGSRVAKRDADFRRDGVVYLVAALQDGIGDKTYCEFLERYSNGGVYTDLIPAMGDASYQPVINDWEALMQALAGQGFGATNSVNQFRLVSRRFDESEYQTMSMMPAERFLDGGVGRGAVSLNEAEQAEYVLKCALYLEMRRRKELKLPFERIAVLPHAGYIDAYRIGNQNPCSLKE